MRIHEPKWYSFKPWNRHSLILITTGFIYVAIGIMFSLQEATQLREENLKFALIVMPYLGWAIGFMVVGVFTMITSRWPSMPKSLGYSALSGWTAAWAAFHIFGGAATGNTAYIASGFAWGMIAFLWWAVSGLIAPPKERTSGGYIDAAGHPIGSVDRSALCLCDTEAGITCQPSDPDGQPSEYDGSGSVRESPSIRLGDDHSSERDDS
ncbi:membrane protein [Gordonia phage Avazak]|uniref:Membrane protein n=1 Tax=Gordonia phage Avazak TaxID=2656529 RepID=A0A649V723_9CAUD|nr:membrane protein [Gordonia phage Avazak]QGJ88014.1 membrane protein [Gordonia phage Avazak]